MLNLLIYLLNLFIYVLNLYIYVLNWTARTSNTCGYWATSNHRLTLYWLCYIFINNLIGLWAWNEVKTVWLDSERWKCNLNETKTVWLDYSFWNWSPGWQNDKNFIRTRAFCKYNSNEMSTKDFGEWSLGRCEVCKIIAWKIRIL